MSRTPWILTRRLVFACAVAMAMLNSPTYAQDNAALLENIAEALPGFTVFNHNEQPIRLVAAVRCLQEEGHVDQVAAAVKQGVGIELRDVAFQLNQRVWDGNYREFSLGDAIRIAASSVQGADALSEFGAVHTFPFQAVLDSTGDEREGLVTRINLGSVGLVATEDNGSYRLVSPNGAANIVERSRSYPDAGTEYRFVARDNSLEGVGSDSRLVSWNAESTVFPAYAFLQTRVINVIARATREAECGAE